jgi:hypothetical protein
MICSTINFNDILIISKLICSATALLGATFLAYHKREGWGWLIFAAIIII